MVSRKLFFHILTSQLSCLHQRFDEKLEKKTFDQ